MILHKSKNRIETKKTTVTRIYLFNRRFYVTENAVKIGTSLLSTCIPGNLIP